MDQLTVSVSFSLALSVLPVCWLTAFVSSTKNFVNSEMKWQQHQRQQQQQQQQGLRCGWQKETFCIVAIMSSTKVLRRA